MESFSNPHPSGPFDKHFFIKIEIWWKIQLIVIKLLTIPTHFVPTTTAQLSCHTKICSNRYVKFVQSNMGSYLRSVTVKTLLQLTSHLAWYIIQDNWFYVLEKKLSVLHIVLDGKKS